MTTMTAGEFIRDAKLAQRSAESGPVIVTEKGQPAFLLLSIEDYRRRVGGSGQRLVSRLAMSEDDFVDDDDFEPGTFSLTASDE